VKITTKTVALGRNDSGKFVAINYTSVMLGDTHCRNTMMITGGTPQAPRYVPVAQLCHALSAAEQTLSQTIRKLAEVG
jgi:hypothetical protein